MVYHLTKYITDDNWNRSTARHLLNRAGFGVSFDLIDQFETMGPRRTVNWLLQGHPGAVGVKEPDWLGEEQTFQQLRKEFKDLDQEQRRQLRKQKRREERQSIERLKIWWLKRMLTSNHPLQEKMTHFWHGHFATSAQKVKSAYFNYDLNETFRQNALGNFKTLVIKVSQSPAMLRYLDNQKNRKGHPNENFARELMELFTVGIGHYSEMDVKEAARAFTGWMVKDGSFFENRRQHDDGPKIFLGHKGYFDGYDIIDILSKQKAMKEFICRKLWEYFVYEKPDDTVVQQLTLKFKQENYELKPLLKTIFNSKEFYSSRSVRQQIKSPAQLLVNLMDQLDIDLDNARDKFLIRAMKRMGQDLFYPPNVKGWPGNRAWINSNTLLARYNLPNDLLYGPFDAKSFFARCEGKTVDQNIRWLNDYFIGMEMDQDQRAALRAAIHPQAGSKMIVPEPAKSHKRFIGVVHLILSSAEYQLC
jgi:uncharacterized protein (DUF1800 family)